MNNKWIPTQRFSQHEQVKLINPLSLNSKKLTHDHILSNLFIRKHICLQTQRRYLDWWEKEIVSSRICLLWYLLKIILLHFINDSVHTKHYVRVTPVVSMFFQYFDQGPNEPCTLVWNSCRVRSLVAIKINRSLISYFIYSIFLKHIIHSNKINENI